VLAKLERPLSSDTGRLRSVLGGGMAVAVRCGVWEWKHNCDVDLFVDIAQEELQTYVSSRLGDGSRFDLSKTHPIYSDDVSEIPSVDLWFSTTPYTVALEFFSTQPKSSEPFAVQRGHIQHFMHQTATPLHFQVTTTGEPTVKLNMNVATVGALLPAKLLSLCEPLFKEHKWEKTFSDIVALLREGADEHLVAQLRTVGRQKDGAEVVKSFSEICRIAADRVVRYWYKPGVMEHIPALTDYWHQSAGQRNVLRSDVPTPEELDAAIDSIDALSKSVKRIEQRCSLEMSTLAM
jgi:hypothetical protein